MASGLGSEAAFAVINEAWFQILANGSCADLSAAGCGTPALLDLLTGVELSSGVLGAYTPALRHTDVCDAYGGSLMLQKEEWDRLMFGVRELWGPSQVLRKAVVAVGRDNRSLLAHVADLAKDGDRFCHAAVLMLLQAAAQLDRNGPLALLKRLPDGEEVAAMPEMKKLLNLMDSSRCRPRSVEGSHGAGSPVAPKPATAETAEACNAPAPEMGQVLFDANLAELPEKMDSGSLVTPQDEAAVLAALPTPPMRKIGSNISKGLLVQYQGEETPGSGTARCCICLESFASSQLWHCGREVCGDKAFCSDCLRQHAEAVIDSGLYAAPAVRCPVCNLRLATVAWAPLLQDETFAKYHENARVLEELKAVSLESQRCEMERLMRPQVQGDPNMRLPLWVWIQAGSAAAVEALLRNAAHEEAVGEDVFIALQRSSGDEESRKQIAEHLREHVGEEQFQMMQTLSATRRLLMELRQALDEERDIEDSVIVEAVANGADPNAREKEDEEESLGLTGLALIAMSYRSSAASVTSSIHALLEAKADLEIEVDDGATPLLVALRHRNMTALEVLAKATAEGSSGPAPRILTEILDEVGCLSEDSRRLRVEELLRPVLKAGGPARAPLPLWTWIEHGSVAAVEALLRSTETVCVEDVITLQRCRLPQREQIQDLLQRKCGEEEFLRLQTEAATRRLLQELREAFDDQRDVKLLTLQNSLDLGADANAQEEESEETAEFQEGSYSLSALQLLVTNLHASEETMRQAVKSLVEAKADVNCEVSETPLLSALQSRCVSGLRAVCEHGARLSSDVLDESKTISSSKVRGALEDILQPLILKDKRLRCPLWIWVQLGSVQASEALVRNASHDEEIDIDVLVGLQRCRGPTVDKEQISNLLQEHLGAEEFQRLSAAAATQRMLLELREAHTEEREPELDLILEALAQGANANAQEEDEDETDEEDAEDEEEDADGSMEEDEAQSESEDKANDEVSEEDDREDGETEPEGEWDE